MPTLIDAIMSKKSEEIKNEVERIFRVAQRAILTGGSTDLLSDVQRLNLLIHNIYTSNRVYNSEQCQKLQGILNSIDSTEKWLSDLKDALTKYLGIINSKEWLDVGEFKDGTINLLELNDTLIIEKTSIQIERSTPNISPTPKAPSMRRSEVPYPEFKLVEYNTNVLILNDLYKKNPPDAQVKKDLNKKVEIGDIQKICQWMHENKIQTQTQTQTQTPDNANREQNSRQIIRDNSYRWIKQDLGAMLEKYEEREKLLKSLPIKGLLIKQELDFITDQKTHLSKCIGAFQMNNNRSSIDQGALLDGLSALKQKTPTLASIISTVAILFKSGSFAQIGTNAVTKYKEVVKGLNLSAESDSSPLNKVISKRSP